MGKVVNYKELERIGAELFDRSQASSLDFATFQRLFREAIAVCGPDSNEMEMFCPFTKPAGWWDWMTQELQKAPSRRVA
jgi:histone H3/H4